MSSSNIQVAIRIRPKLQREEIDMCNVCTRVAPGEPQIWIGQDKAFTFDYVFDMSSKQCQIYDNCVKTLVDGCFDGYNATIFAYGQTGSGKTYTMGTGFDISYPEEQKGIIPRAVEHLFKSVDKRKDTAKNEGLPVPEFVITAQFIEIYNEEVIDLLSDKSKKGHHIRIHEDIKKGITLLGAETKLVTSIEETLNCLKSGSLFRTTGATLMNSESSRSHAIFTLFIKQNRVDKIEIDENIPNNVDTPHQEVVTLTAKFNFVDLAGSERLSRTGAVGERAREGISINSGLLHLGNVISALGDRSKKMTHIPYRDSKLTRILQDSLGGNSVTTMIACISPCDRDFVETLNTLRYANRAKNIKNKIVANQDSQTQLINDLRRQILQLQIENQELRQGKLFVKDDGEVELNDVYHENKMLQRELNNANVRIKALNTRLEDITNENILLNERITKMKISADSVNDNGDDYPESLIKGYLKEIMNLRSKVVESEHLISNYRKQLNQQENELEFNDSTTILEKAKDDIELGKKYYNQLNNSIISSDTNGNRFSDDEEEDFNDDEYQYQKELNERNAELVNIMENLASKERLIEEFEASERRINKLTEQYEQKITTYKSQIRQIQEERDALLNKIKKENKDDQISKAKKEEYEKKLSVLQKEVRKYEALKREHQKILHQDALSKEQVKRCRQEMLEAKQKQVKLITQMRDQMGRHSKELLKNRLMINKLTKEDHKKVVKIRDLEVRSNNQKKMLQRREEEIKALKRMVKPMSERAAGRFFKQKANGSTPQKARNKWNSFELKFNKIVAQRLTFELEEKKLERCCQERQKCIDILNALKDDSDSNEDLEAIRTNIDYLDRTIKDIQNIITEMEDETINIEQLFNTLDPDEVAYILDKLAHSAINYAITSSQREAELKEKEAVLTNIAHENAYNKKLLDYMVSNGHIDDDDIYIPDKNVMVIDSDKTRRLTMTPSELLYSTKSIMPSDDDPNDNNGNHNNVTYCIAKEEEYSEPSNDNENSENNVTVKMKPSLNVNGTTNIPIPTLKPMSSASSLNEQNSTEQYNGTPPCSPLVNRRLNREISTMSSSMTNENDVFSRLTGNNSTVANQVENSVGQIVTPNQLKIDKFGQSKKPFPLSCTHYVVGHRRAVLSVTATNEVLFSGSKDGTAKIWDLSQCVEVFSLNDHPDAVNVVRYDEYNKLIFTCSKSLIKIWDPRQSPINCVKILCSTGMITENVVSDNYINDIRLSADGTTLFSTNERLVRVWDLRTFNSLGKLTTGHKSLVTCLAVDDDEINDTKLVITGSKDHTVKVFELENNFSGIQIPKYSLKPPHYDGIEALRLTDKGRCLFSGGRDGCIKKWSLTEQRCVASLGNCHRDWVLALDTFLQGSILLSACRSGFLRVWGTENCHSYGEIQAHSAAVNDIATIPQVAFTASSDCNICLWQQTESNSIEDGE